ncbi:LysR family transcriptional regulator, mexEF-oprN operon transcriptional activator [Pseudomonas sp. NFACC15-1]|uniref:LysR family transcriptional regulator n=1 Tax=unclassified Pseudomonas TaxID=196821 RepID=UPI000882E2A7|nr:MULTISPECIES: LysR family transcriptional regulator [unclassified Pseudomonas]SDA37987.1 LysR family transcriptional regulator, mexEF-oprN operon transcriptional activator [Pseudomonas sp. NFACC15-1]SDW22550.1 LysR family transcriptional regulator, mexEF-oprN operon transcriptional activator [Pseudomonas sp. NFACC14]
MMNRNDLRRADIHLLVVFETMMYERNVSRVGEKLLLSQSTISAALGRLRHLFDDPLFIRTGRVMEPTSRAQEIFSNLTPALDSIAAALSQCQAFDPTTSEATFHIGLPDDFEYVLLPCLLRRMRIEAPNIRLVVRRADQWKLPQLLASGEISLGISHTLQLPANTRCKGLRSSHPMLLRADSQLGELDLDEFCRRPHAVVSSMGNVIEDADRALHLIGRQRKVVLAVPQFSALPMLLAGSEMIVIVPDYVAQAMSGTCGMRAEAVPLSLPQQELSMVWRGAAHNDTGERWLRSRCSVLLGTPAEEPARQSLSSSMLAVA